MESREIQEIQDALDFRVLLVCEDTQEREACKGMMDLLEILGSLDHLDQKEEWVLDSKGLRDAEEMLDLQDYLVNLVVPVPLEEDLRRKLNVAQRAARVNQAWTVLQAGWDYQDQMAEMAAQDIQG
jgi:hypothetical protein